MVTGTAVISTKVLPAVQERAHWSSLVMRIKYPCKPHHRIPTRRDGQNFE